jgi:hypothetical protein
MAPGEGPEFKPQYHKKERERENYNKGFMLIQ